jgi:hypothetical protein
MRGDVLRNNGRNPSPCASQQARLGVLATRNARIRRRMREGRGDDVAAVQSVCPPLKLCLGIVFGLPAIDAEPFERRTG